MIEYATSLKYMLAGYAVMIAVFVIYIASLFTRWRNLKRDIQTLKEYQK
jgi:hypothetical protein